MIILATIWILLVMPAAGPDMPKPSEHQLEGVYFASMQDCETFARDKGRFQRLVELGYTPPRNRHWTRLSTTKEKHAPDGATTTYTCIEQEQ